jgi:hypothetical protein
MDFLILTPSDGGPERRVNLRHVVQFFRTNPADEHAGTTFLLIDDNELQVADTVTKIEIAIRKLNGKLIAA